jgi:activator of HSP90 ATPase
MHSIRRQHPLSAACCRERIATKSIRKGKQAKIFLKEEKMKNTIKQTVTFSASPKEVFSLLMDSKKHSTLTKARATISKKVGGKISAYDGYITGTNIELKTGKLIVQSWHAADWPDDYESTVKFSLQKVKAGTKLTFTHINVPLEDVEDLKIGWKDNYWKLMKEYFIKGKNIST